MRKLSMYVSVLALALASCVSKEEHEKLRTELEAAQFELETNQKYITALQDVSTLMDSIDEARDDLNADMESGTSPDDYVDRMQGIHDYIKQTEQKIDQLQSEMQKSDKNTRAYTRTIAKLRKDLSKKTNEITVLQAKVDAVEQENSQLLTSLSARDSVLVEKNRQIDLKKEELALIESKIEELMANSKLSEADAYFVRAASIEETANRTKFAPKKKKATIKEAIGLYEMALGMGRSDAQEKIDALQKKI